MTGAVALTPAPGHVLLSPSILSADFARLADDCQRVLDMGADWCAVSGCSLACLGRGIAAAATADWVHSLMAESPPMPPPPLVTCAQNLQATYRCYGACLPCLHQTTARASNGGGWGNTG